MLRNCFVVRGERTRDSDRALLLRLHRDAVRGPDHPQERRLCRAAGAGAGAGPRP
jgi:hypothetical protein